LGSKTAGYGTVERIYSLEPPPSVGCAHMTFERPVCVV
jgi:hypothetical protein